MKTLRPLCASKDDFSSFIAGQEGVVSEAFERQEKFANATYSDKKFELDKLDVSTAIESILDFQDRAEKLLDMIPASEAATNTIIDKFLNSDRTKMVEHYREEIKSATTTLELNALIDEIENDIRKMDEFVDGQLTLEAFLRWLVSFMWIFGMTVGFGLLGLTGSTLVAADRYQNVERIRNKTRELIPHLKKLLGEAKAKYNKLASKR